MREISRPLEVIDELLEPFSACLSVPGALPPREWREKAHFLRTLKLEDEDNFQDIPCLNETDTWLDVPSQSLVRYRCMVQDVLEPEVYPLFLQSTGALVTMKYREALPTGSHAKPLSTLETGNWATRGIYLCVPLPGESSWAIPRRGPNGASECGPGTSAPNTVGCSCLVKLYDVDEESLKVCETVEVLGVFHMGAGAPRLHGLHVRKLPFFHPMLPYSPRWLSEGRLLCTFQRRFSGFAVRSLRDLAIQILQEPLGGDQLAAEYVLALLVARVYGNDGSRALGRWSLNLSHWQEGSVDLLVRALAKLHPRVLHLPVTPETLKQRRWTPQKDFDANRLRSGLLQLAPGTLLVFDETQMDTGPLDAAGLRAVQGIRGLASEQMLLVDFFNYEVQVPLEVNCLFISRGVSIFKAADLVLPLSPTRSSVLPKQEDVESLDGLRFLLGLIQHRTQPLRLQQIMAVFSHDFARLRDEFREMDLGQQTLHVWVALARAFCFTHGEEEMTVERWQSVATIERERCRRWKEFGLKA
ncbi:Mini-chromosome maintenance complex-binding protein (MCM-BP) (MCM-binding protein) (Protein E2F TARGET GENE 1) [Durusdinium trenchii]|uniref:Mini-chromosome maintenance complex-binding protein (MCM-BP) (MCM-binding protein) (Protein E2F TARGET GENE 1) n=1 Tax=Durusdinium trenchii TaxID=1381693 RepID=A0ABP0JFT9_9DINO